jgi:sec-independent protein translocase protein TatC
VETQTIREHTLALLKTIGASLGLVLVCSIVVHSQRHTVIDFLLQPLGNGATPLQFLSPLDPLFFILKVDFTLGFLLSFPIVFLLFWRFIAPATHAKLILGIAMVLATSVLALLAAAYSYLLVVPIVLEYMSSIVIAGTVTAFTAHGYLNFLLSTTFLLVAIFQIPLTLIGAGSLGLVTASQLTSRRKYIYTGTLILTAFITPTTDIITLALITAPTVIVIEVGIIGVWLLQRKSERAAKSETSAP